VSELDVTPEPGEKSNLAVVRVALPQELDLEVGANTSMSSTRCLGRVRPPARRPHPVQGETELPVHKTSTPVHEIDGTNRNERNSDWLF
jgi:hypothetical protein